MDGVVHSLILAIYLPTSIIISMKETIPKRKCLRCGHEWFIRKVEARICPKCKSAYWNKEKESKPKQ